MIGIESDVVSARVDPMAGACIRELRGTCEGAPNVLASYDWVAPQPSARGGSYGDQVTSWLSSYRGGWHLLTPNAGAACIVDGIAHPFHGESSAVKWSVLEQERASILLEAGSHGPLSFRRLITCDEAVPAVSATTELWNRTSIPAVAVLVEHIALDASGNLRLESAPDSTWRLDGHSLEHEDPVRWQEASLTRPIDEGSKFSVMTGGHDGRMRATRADGWQVDVRWDSRHLPFMWLWQERATPGFPWFGRADIVGLEPASLDAPDGLAAARDRGQAFVIAPGESITTRVDVLVTAPDLASRGSVGD